MNLTAHPVSTRHQGAGNTNTSITTSPKQPSPLAPLSPAQQPSVKSTLGSGKQKSSNLLYGMFSRSVDGTRWQCEECKKLFSSQGSLRAHARIHTGERPYQCQYCYRTFCQASTLRSHERLHTGEKPYKCEYCGRAFTQSAGLRSHLKTHRYDSWREFRTPYLRCIIICTQIRCYFNLYCHIQIMCWTCKVCQRVRTCHRIIRYVFGILPHSQNYVV